MSEQQRTIDALLQSEEVDNKSIRSVDDFLRFCYSNNLELKKKQVECIGYGGRPEFIDCDAKDAFFECCSCSQNCSAGYSSCGTCGRLMCYECGVDSFIQHACKRPPRPTITGDLPGMVTIGPEVEFDEDAVKNGVIRQHGACAITIVGNLQINGAFKIEQDGSGDIVIDNTGGTHQAVLSNADLQGGNIHLMGSGDFTDTTIICTRDANVNLAGCDVSNMDVVGMGPAYIEMVDCQLEDGTLEVCENGNLKAVDCEGIKNLYLGNGACLEMKNCSQFPDNRQHVRFANGERLSIANQIIRRLPRASVK